MEINYLIMAQEIKKKLKDILLWINIGKIANHYFQKNSSWLYAKFDNENTEFTPEEVEQLKGALIDLSDRIRRCADTL